MTSKELIINYLKNNTGGAVVLHGLDELFLSVLDGNFNKTDSITEICNNLTGENIPESDIDWSFTWNYIKVGLCE